MEKIYYNIKNCDFKYDITEIEEGNVRLVNFKFHSEKPIVPSNLAVWFFVPAVDAYSLWSPNGASLRVLSPYGFVTNVESGIANGAPVAALISKSGMNRITVATDDVETALNIKFCVCEDNQSVLFDVTLFTEITHPITDYEFTLRLDMTEARYESVLRNIEEWWQKHIPSCNVPDAARQPVYSTWYNYHQKLNDEELLEECRAAVEYGMKTIIVDDGWQTGDNNKGYSYCGDWCVESTKIKDMKAFVDNIHKLGMKIMLWYSVPYMGVNSKNFAKFEGKYLNNTDCGFGILDPRFPECRHFTVELYKNAVHDWGLDGLKLDFIDSIKLSEFSSKDYDKMDCISLEEAISVLLKEIGTTLKALNPDFMIEFRQRYTGPVVRQIGNMLRVGDCPCSAEQNKMGTVDIRLLSGKTAVHSDMVMWHVNDTAESVALQLIATMYSVPQISVKLNSLTDKHKKVLAFYMDFWHKNRELLLDGKLTALNPESLYSLVKSELDNRAVITAYSRADIDVSNLEGGSVINATGEDTFVIKANGNVEYSVCDCMGMPVAGNQRFSDVKIISIPKGGMLNFKKF